MTALRALAMRAAPTIYAQLRQWAALIIYEHTEDREQVRIEWHQTGMVRYQNRTRVYVESDVGGIGPGKWIG